MDRGRILSVMFLAVFILIGAPVLAQDQKPEQGGEGIDADVTQGALRVKQPDGKVVECPLKHTDVRADVSGFIARVKVTQTFFNPFDDKIEAVYVFPLPHESAVDDMTMVIGDKRIVGVIKRREEARYIYEQALRQGMTASLLEQERPNIFTQSVGNIKPKQEVRIEISYVDVLKYDMGVYEFHFPMVVGPRYIPGSPTTTPPGGGWAPNTDRVPDASRITPPVLKPGFRTGHDISLALTLDAGVPVRDLQVESHKTEIKRDGDVKASVKLSPGDSIPNKDFVLKYAVIGEKPEMAMLTHCTKGAGYFMLMVQPRIDEQLKQAPPREVCFLIDVSGSMSGQPTAKVQDAMRKFFELAKPDDRMQVITFASQAQKLFPQSVAAAPENVSRALNFTNAIQGGGGTEMLKGIKMVLNEPVDPERVRIVVMLTDGYIGNEAEIIAEVGKCCGDKIRFWTVGVGTSVNRFLLDGVAKQGGGMSAVLALNEDPTKLVREMVERIHRAQLADIKINWGGLPIYETYPVKVPELWAGRPVILFGRYEAGGKAEITISGKAEGNPLSYSLDVEFPEKNLDHEVLAKVWARKKIEDLSAMAYYGDSPPVVEEITEIALAYRLMSQYTSFVAVDESEKDKIKGPVARPPRVMVPVPMPEGVSYEGVFGPAEPEMERKDVREKRQLGFGFLGKAMAPHKSGMAPMAPRPASKPMSATGEAGAYGVRGFHRSAGGAAAPALAVAQRTRVKTKKVEMLALTEEREEAAPGAYATGGRLAAKFLQESSAKQREEAKKVVAEAEELKKKGEIEPAIRKLQFAFLLEKAFLAANPWQDDGTCATIANELNELLDKLTDEQARKVPALGKTMDIVIRHSDVAQALAEVAKAAGVEIAVAPGSIEDATELLLTKPRVVYRDLRGATAAQAIQWIVEPFHMTWTVRDGKVLVGTSRRLPGEVAWAYRIGDIAIPTSDELGKDYNKAAKRYEEALKTLLAAVQEVDKSAVLIGVSDLLAYGDASTHEKMAALLKALRDPSAAAPVEETDALKKLREATAKRHASRKEGIEKYAKALAVQRLAASLDENSWKLLADAAVGKLNAEAMANLEESFADTNIQDAAKANPVNVFRSAWALDEAAKALGREAGLQQLAAQARQVCKENVEAVAKLLKTNLQNPHAFAPVLYGALVTGDADLKGKAVADSVPAIYRAISQVMLAGGGAEALADEMSKTPVQGDDLVALEALAAKRAGGRAWEVFRAGVQESLGNNPLDGSVVLLVSRLSSPTCLLCNARAAGK